jgi:type VI protein secretion system component Hcp
MAIIILKIPDGTGKFIRGESTLYDYRDLPLADDVAYDISAETEITPGGTRSMSLPVFSNITVTRSVDVSTMSITRLTLKGSVSTAPWELLFFRPLSADNATVLKFMSLKLHAVLIHNQQISADDSKITETLILSATKLEWDYAAFSEDQQKTGNFSFSYDIGLGSST